jgi:hypothetical protein
MKPFNTIPSMILIALLSAGSALARVVKLTDAEQS